MIKALLGHARIGVTSGYILTPDSLVLSAAEKVARYVAGAMTGENGKVLKLPAGGRNIAADACLNSKQNRTPFSRQRNGLRSPVSDLPLLICLWG